MTAKPDISHFAQRCRERGVTITDPDWIDEQLRKAFVGEEHDLELAERVMPSHGHDAEFWRFRVLEGIFYAAIGSDGNVRTVLTQAMIRRKKFKRRTLTRGGRRNRVVQGIRGREQT